MNQSAIDNLVAALDRRDQRIAELEDLSARQRELLNDWEDKLNSAEAALRELQRYETMGIALIKDANGRAVLYAELRAILDKYVPES